ncbi:MAG: major facilitator superfamily 1 [Verrucomicrobiales bacterium]|nr:major facilitator superfamily 1 [Verrucomicrobiales bacterium]
MFIGVHPWLQIFLSIPVSQDSKITRYAWIVVALLWVVALLNYLDRLMLTTMHDPIKASISMTEKQFGLLTSVFLWVYGALSPLGGYLADRFNRRTVIMVSLFVWSAVTWWTGHVHSFEQLLAARALMGISEACYIPAALALIADYHRGSTRSLATGLHMSGIYAGAALGGVGAYIAQHSEWRFGFTIFGAIGVIYAVFLIFTLKDAPKSVSVIDDKREKIQVPAVLRALFSQPGFWLLIALNALVGSANWSINGWLPTYLKEHFHLGLGEAGMSATAYIQVASFAGVLIGGSWADRWSRTNSRGRSLVPAIGYMLAGPCLLLSAVTNEFPLAIAGLIVFGLGRGFFDANHMPIVRQVADERYSATAYGFMNFISCAAGGVMVYIGGALKDVNVPLSRIFAVSALGLFIVGLILLFLKPAQSQTSH